jgi:SnoaL-like domain
MMEKATKVFTDYAAAFEQTYVDDDWSRLAPFFSDDATYEVRGGPFACTISGRDAIFAGLKKSIDGLDRRCSDRRIELTEGPNAIDIGSGQELSIRWRVSYQYGDAPKMVLPGRSVFTVADGVIVAMRDEYDEKEIEGVGAWMLKYGEGLDGSYV